MSRQGRKPGDRRRTQADSDRSGGYPDTVKLQKLELMSTQRLTRLLAEEQGGRKAVQAIAESADEGYLARDAATGMFRIIDDDELQALLDQDAGAPDATVPPTPAAPAAPAEPVAGNDELSLVTTQALRKILTVAEPAAAKPEKKPENKDPGGGFNPYDHS